MKQKLRCLSEKVADDLYANVENNIDRYKNGDFEELSTSYGWSVELQVYADLEPIKDLDPNSGAENEVKNALLVWRALSDLTPSLACENRIWARLTHVEGFGFSRKRWLKTDTDEKVAKSVRDHFFADTRTKWRDDNAISRLWWSAYIAALIPGFNQEQVLRLILSKADIRLNFVERPWISSRPKLAAGIIRQLINDSWITEKEANFRALMRQVNKFGGGVLYEVWDDKEIDEFISSCTERARRASMS